MSAMLAGDLVDNSTKGDRKKMENEMIEKKREIGSIIFFIMRPGPTLLAVVFDPLECKSCEGSIIFRTCQSTEIV
jgi:hypothetical protein